MAIFGARSFEAGTMLNDADTTLIGLGTLSLTAKTGLRSLRLGGVSTAAGYARWLYPGTPANPAVSCWLFLPDTYMLSGVARVRFLLGTGEFIELRWNNVTFTFDAYVNNVLVALGTFEVSNNTWFHLQASVTIANAGSISVIIDGHSSIAWNGDTQPGAATGCTYLSIGKNSGNVFVQVDDLVWGTAGPLGVLYCEDIRPDADSAVQWTPSVGGANWDTIDEVPASDVDYNYTDVDGRKDLLGLTNFDATDKAIVALGAWVRARMVDAAGDSIIVGVSSNAIEVDTTHLVSAAYEYYHHVAELDPDTGAPWGGVGVNAALLKYAAVIT